MVIGSPLSRFVLGRLFSGLLVMAGVVTAVFFIQRAVPGDPAENILGEQASDMDKEAFRCLLYTSDAADE